MTAAVPNLAYRAAVVGHLKSNDDIDGAMEEPEDIRPREVLAAFGLLDQEHELYESELAGRVMNAGVIQVEVNTVVHKSESRRSWRTPLRVLISRPRPINRSTAAWVAA